MKQALFAGLLFLVVGHLPAHAQTPVAAPASDNPTAGLDLGEPTVDASNHFQAQFQHRLVTLEGDRVKSFDPTPLQGVKFYAFYYSASWCPPCRLFTPQLVQFYNDFKAKHPNFELVFVSSDYSAEYMEAYMQKDAMKWPAARFEEIRATGLLQFRGPGIPDLVLVDGNGKVLSDSWQDGQYTGPEHVVDDIKKLVP